MIVQDQPTCFPKGVLVAVSSVSDGSMLDRAMGVHDGSIVSNRTKFGDQLGVDYGDMVYQRIVYSEKRTYNLICEVDDGSTTKNTSEVVADALWTNSRGVGLMLPVADCIATVIYDPASQSLVLLHLGRHSTLAGLLARTLQRLKGGGSSMDEVIVWMSPSIQSQNYVMEYFAGQDDPTWRDFFYKTAKGYHLDMQGYNRSVCLAGGVPSQNIHISDIDTATSPDYFSHYAGDTKSRIAVVAAMI